MKKKKICRLSSAGRAFALQAEGREFESLSLYSAEFINFARFSRQRTYSKTKLLRLCYFPKSKLSD